MFLKVLQSKIHRATITKADLAYEGSITLPGNLLLAAGIQEFQQVAVWNVTNGNRLETYAIENRDLADNHTICMNGAAAHLIGSGDLVIIAAYGYLTPDEVKTHKPKIVFVNEHNLIKSVRDEVAGPAQSAASPVSTETNIKPVTN